MQFGIPSILVLLLATLTLGTACTQNDRPQNDWTTYGRDPGAQRYSPLTQINPANVNRMIEAWTIETNPGAPQAKPRQSSTTPLMVNNVLYFATPYQRRTNRGNMPPTGRSDLPGFAAIRPFA